MTDEELLARIAAERDREAFRILYERYALKLCAFMRRSGASQEEAEEAAQEALIAVWRRAETFDQSRASAAAWLFTIARNRRIDLLRRSARSDLNADEPAFQPEAPRPAEAQIAAARRDGAVRAALDSLSEDQKMVVRLSFFEGVAHSEIAERLELPLGTVKSRLRLAFQKLRQTLGAEFHLELRED